MKLFRQTYFPIIEAGIALMIVLLPLSNNPDLMNGIQTAKSFNIFHKIFFNKEIKVHSKAIEEMKLIVDQHTSEQTLISNNSGLNYRQKGRDNHTSSRKVLMVPLPDALSNNLFPKAGKTIGKEVR